MMITKPGNVTSNLTFTGLIYGQPGVGKTTLALSASNPILIDIDHGMYRIEARHQKDSLQVEKYTDILDLLKSDEIKNYDTIVFDTLGKLVDRICDYVATTNPKLRQADGALAIKGWGVVKVTFANLIKIIQGLNKSTIFVAHESEEKDGDVTKKRPDVSGSARKDIVKELDFLGYMEMIAGKRTISFNPNEKYYAKNSCGLYDIIEIPSFASGAPNTFIVDKIEKALREKREKDAIMLSDYNELIAKITEDVAAIKDANQFNDYIKYAKTELKTIWDSKFRLSEELKKQKALLGLELNKTTNTFYKPESNL